MAEAEARPMYVVPNWIERHCVIPDGFRAGAPFRLYQDQGEYVLAFYSVKPTAYWDPANPIKGPAFVYRRALVVGPQKVGKDPAAAAHICVESVGPALFAGWAGKDDGYACAAHGCACGWEYAYRPGEPMGMRWPTPLIQITGVSEDATANTYNALRPMIDNGPLHDLIPNTGESLIRLPAGGDSKIERVTSSAPARLGAPSTFVSHGEDGLYSDRNGMVKVAETQRRNCAGMGGRTTANTNAWDPAQNSDAQRAWESVHPKDPKVVPLTDIFIQFRQPPANLSFGNREQRWKIYLAIYPTDVRRENGGHLDLNSIEPEAVDLMRTNPADAARFFGNKLVPGSGAAFDLGLWEKRRSTVEHVVPKGALITIGADGSVSRDHFPLIATEVASGYQWPLAIFRPEDHHGRIPTDVVSAVVDQAFADFDVWRLYGDPPFIQELLDAWAGRYGRDRIIEWATNRPRVMALATRAWDEAIAGGSMSHCPTTHPLCQTFTWHVGNAVRHETGYRDDGGALWYAEKNAPNSPDKIDSVPAAILSWEARNDAIASGALSLEPAVEPFVFTDADL